mmetsp:Transcript_43398/g.114336  ORF Transcript_43398/g.114336 Transcript_43398/m.114336 type:complete len:222 (+) Transcript_43398:1209-1874(+)
MLPNNPPNTLLERDFLVHPRLRTAELCQALPRESIDVSQDMPKRVAQSSDLGLEPRLTTVDLQNWQNYCKKLVASTYHLRPQCPNHLAPECLNIFLGRRESCCGLHVQQLQRPPLFLECLLPVIIVVSDHPHAIHNSARIHHTPNELVWTCYVVEHLGVLPRTGNALERDDLRKPDDSKAETDDHADPECQMNAAPDHKTVLVAQRGEHVQNERATALHQT